MLTKQILVLLALGIIAHNSFFSQVDVKSEKRLQITSFSFWYGGEWPIEPKKSFCERKKSGFVLFDIEFLIKFIIFVMESGEQKENAK